MYGKGSISSDAMGSHKEMAGAKMKGDMGVGAYPGRDVPHPDLKMKHMPMDDGQRMAPMTGKRGLMQSAPDHGPMGKDHFSRGSKI